MAGGYELSGARATGRIGYYNGAMQDVTSLPRRARFSLRTLLLVMLIAAFAVAQYVSLRRVREVELRNQELFNENAKLRVEAGYVKIEDRSKVAVLQLRELDELTWRWK